MSWLTLAALLGCALVGGVFYAFSTFVMAALGRLPDPRGHEAMCSINVTVLRPGFLVPFVGTALACAALLVDEVLGWQGTRSAWTVLGAGLYICGTFLLTGLGNVPLNEALARSAPEAPEARTVWRRYLRRWTFLNHLRTAAALAAALCLGLALR